MTERFTEATGTSGIGGIEHRGSRSMAALLVPVVGTGAVLALVPLWLGDSGVMMGLAVGGLTFAAYAIGFNLIFGSTGQLFLCVGALAGIGGYGAAILADKAGWPLLIGVIAATLAAGGVGGLLSWVAVRRSLGVIFTGIITLIFSLVFTNLILGLGSITGGDGGFHVQAGADTFLRQRIPPYYLMLGVVLAYLVVHGLLRRSRVGWAFRALRDDELAAEMTGVNVSRYRVVAASLGAAMLGLSGAVNAFTEGTISPTTYGFSQVDVTVLVMLAFGGIGTLFGPVLGAVVFSVIDELLVDLGQLRVVVYGALVIVLFLWIPRGVIPTLADLLKARARSTTISRPGTTPAPPSSTAPGRPSP
ncbi:MAG TPA: branched-chain amino acid ABC transporter permease [Acidimicrobiia bacterium]|jgi:branched-chain amino acid transport system permease protein